MVAPNSPIALAKARIMPAMTPGRMSGRVTVRKTQRGLAPSVPAASSSLRSTASMERRMERTISGKPMTPQASAAPVQRKDSTTPNHSSSREPMAPRRPNRTSNRKPVTTGGRISGMWTMPFKSDLPQKRPRASASATRMPSGRLTRTATVETLRLNRIAVHSSSLKASQSTTFPHLARPFPVRAGQGHIACRCRLSPSPRRGEGARRRLSTYRRQHANSPGFNAQGCCEARLTSGSRNPAR
jgi:hypothetical protein